MSVVRRRPPPRAIEPAPRWRSPFRSLAIGVGSNEPHPVASMGRTDVASSKHTPASIVPQVGKSSEDGSESASAKHRGVFGEHIRRPNFANDAELLEPKA